MVVDSITKIKPRTKMIAPMPLNQIEHLWNTLGTMITFDLEHVH